MTTRIKMAAAVLGAVAIVVAGCGKSNLSENSASAPVSTTSSAGPSSPAAAATITIDNFKFKNVTVPPGAQVTVVTNDFAEQSVTSDTAGAFDVEVEGKKQATFTAPTQPGT